MAPTSPTQAVDVVDELASRAAVQRPDLSTAFADDGWLGVRVTDVVINRAGLAFSAGEVALARPAIARHVSDFIAFSERLGSLVGLRHGDHFRFLDEDAATA
jgi:hypothetical protein